MYHSLYIRSIIKVWGKVGKMAEKGKKLRESMFLSIYRVYNKRVYKEHAERVRKVRGKECAGKSVSFFCIEI